MYLSLSSRMYCVLLLMDYMLYTCLHRCAFSNARFKYEVARVQYELCARLLLFISLNNLMEYLCSIFYCFACPEKPCEEQDYRSFRIFSTFFTTVLFIFCFSYKLLTNGIVKLLRHPMFFTAFLKSIWTALYLSEEPTVVSSCHLC